MLPTFDKIPQKPLKKDKRIRYQWRFWLDARKDDELLMCEQLDECKAKRQFAPTIRNALRLWFDLAAGNTTVLRELFPGIVADLERTDESQANSEFTALIDLQRTQEQILERLDAIPATVTSTATIGNIAPVNAVNRLPASVNLEALPGIFADDTPASDPGEARATFAASMGDLFGDSEDDLWD